MKKNSTIQGLMENWRTYCEAISLDIEVGDPAELAVDVSFFGEARVVGHARAFDFVLLIGVQLAVRLQQDVVLVPEVLPKVLLQTAIGEIVSGVA